MYGENFVVLSFKTVDTKVTNFTQAQLDFSAYTNSHIEQIGITLLVLFNRKIKFVDRLFLLDVISELFVIWDNPLIHLLLFVRCRWDGILQPHKTPDLQPRTFFFFFFSRFSHTELDIGKKHQLL